jgi:hypothetical protein
MPARINRGTKKHQIEIRKKYSVIPLTTVLMMPLTVSSERFQEVMQGCLTETEHYPSRF